jgi:hypothetical protein
MDITGATNTVDVTEEPIASTRVVLEVADALGIDPLEVEQLNAVVDADALDRLAEGSTPSVRVSFRLSGCSVVVDGSGDVDVTPPAGYDGSDPDAPARSGTRDGALSD